MNQAQSNKWIVDLIIRIVSGWSVVTGLFTIAGGPDRWTAPIYTTLNYMPGSPMTWGVFLTVGGVLGFVGSYYKQVMRNVGLYIVGLWCFILSAGIVTVFNDTNVSYNTPLLYILIGIICLALTKGR